MNSINILLKAAGAFLVAAVAIILLFRALTLANVRLAEKLYPPRGKFVKARESRLHYLRQGKGRPVVFIHGSFGSTYDFLFSLFDEAAKSYDAIAFDRPGHGYSQRPAGPVDAYAQADFLHEALTRLEIRKPLLAAHSLGASVALAYAENYPDDLSAVVLLAGYVTPYDGPAAWMHRLPEVPVIGQIYLWAFVNPLGKWLAPKAAQKVFSPNRVPKNYGRAASLIGVRPSQFQANAEDIRLLPDGLRRVNERLAEITKPVVFVTGDSDQIAPAERHAGRVAPRLKISEIVMLENTGHRPAFVHPEKVMSVIDMAWRLADRPAKD